MPLRYALALYAAVCLCLTLDGWLHDRATPRATPTAAPAGCARR